MKRLDKWTRVSILWSATEVVEEGCEGGWYPGVIVGYPSDIDRIHGDHLVLYDDEKKKGNVEPIIERLYGKGAEEWKLL